MAKWSAVNSLDELLAFIQPLLGLDDASRYGAALAFEESWSVWDAVTLHQVQASNLPLIYIEVILKRISQERKAFNEKFCGLEAGVRFGLGKVLFKWEQSHYYLVGRFIEKLMVMLRSSTTQAEEDVFKQTEAVEQMYEAEVQNKVTMRAWTFRKGVLFLPRHRTERFILCFYTRKKFNYMVMVLLVSLLVFMYRYFTGYVDGGGSLTCSSGSSQFKAIFISVVLFDGAYIWIKFRDAASTSSGVKRRSQEDGVSGPLTISKSRKIEARFTPPGQSGDHLYLCMCSTIEEVAIMKQIAALLYNGEEKQVELGGGRYYQVSLTLRKGGEGLSLQEKRKWVAKTIKEEYKLIPFEKVIDPASLHPSKGAAKYISFKNEHLLGSLAQEIPISNAVTVTEDVCNGAATSNELCMGKDVVLQESAFGEGAMVSCFLSAQEGVQNLDLATPVGVNFGMALTGESGRDESAMIPISGKDEEIQELKYEKQTIDKRDQAILDMSQTILDMRQTILDMSQTILDMNQELKQKILELEQRARESDNWIAELDLDEIFSGALPCVDPEMMEFDLNVLV